jgi:hypothetical protein
MEQKNTFTSGTGTIGTGNHNVSQSTGAIGSCTFLSIPNDTDVTVKLRGFDSNGTPFFSIINLTTSAE